MDGGEQSVERTERLDAEETMARLVECPRVNPSPLVQHPDSAADLGGLSDRGRRHLGRLAVRQMDVLPLLGGEIGGTALRSVGAAEGDREGGAA